MMAWPVKSDEGTASICEVVVCRKSYSTAPRPVRATSSSDNPSRLLFINNLELRLSITRSFGNRTVFDHVGARMSLRLLKITFVAMAVCAAALTLSAATPPRRDANSLDQVIKRVQEQQNTTNILPPNFRPKKEPALPPT